MDWVYDDGGRSRYFKGEAGDCVCRAIAIALDRDYKEVYDDLAKLNEARCGKRSARNGIDRKDIHKYLADNGFAWTATMKFGQGCRVHMREDELPEGRLVLNLSRHLTAVVDGVCHDTYDPSRDGTRCVYGYWSQDARAEGRDQARRSAEARDAFAEKMEAACADLKAGRIDPGEFMALAREWHGAWLETQR